jgi:hypothetical protein
MAKRKSQSDHDVMVKQVADILISKRHQNVKADLKGYIQPNLLRWKGENSGHIPDVTSQLDGKLKIIVEVETDDSINDQHTSDQWKLFSAYAKRDNAEFIIVVPKGAEAKAEKRKNELNVEGEVEGI